MMGEIYKILNLINGRCYVGQTTNTRKREIRHFSHLRRGAHPNWYLQEDYDLYGEDAFRFIVLESGVPKSELYTREVFWANLLRSEYNIGTPGYAPQLGRKHSDETKKKMSATRVGRSLSKEALARLIASNRGRKHTDEARANMSRAHIGHVPSEEARAKNGAAHRGRKLTDEHRAKMRKTAEENLGKPIKQIDILTGATLRIWPSIRRAAEELGISRRNISAAAKGVKCKTAGGYRWEFNSIGEE